MAPVTEDTMRCGKHPRYKAIRKPHPGCVICHAIWQMKLVQKENKDKRSHRCLRCGAGNEWIE